MVLWLRKRSVYFAAKMPAEQAEAWQKRSKHKRETLKLTLALTPNS